MRTPPTAPLAGLKVLELASGIAAGYAGKLFADLGAEVAKVEPPGGDPLRGIVWSDPGTEASEDGALFRFLAAGKRSVVGSLGDPEVDGLVAACDVVVESGPPLVPRLEPLLREPGVVVVSITPYGRRGPWAGRPGNEHVAQAESGSIASRGTPELPPVAAGGAIGEWVAGAYAAAVALVALGDEDRFRQALHIDVALVDVLCTCTNLYADLMMSLLGRPPLAQPARTVEFPSIEQSADGWVAFNTTPAQMNEDFLVLVGRADLAGDPLLRADPARLAELQASTRAFCRDRKTEELVELASLLRVPASPVGNGENLPHHPHLVARAVFRTFPDGSFLAPAAPFLLDGQRPGPRGSAPRCGADRGLLRWQPRDPGDRAARRRRWRRGPGAGPGDLPLAGLRVLDLTCWWAGPGVTQLLAAFGADVVHVESAQRMDGMRAAATLPFAHLPRWWEYSCFFLSINVNKKDVTLNLEDPRGLELAFRLVDWADVVVENFTPRVLERFGLDWEAVHARNPEAVMLRMPAFGLDGPWRDRQGFAQTIEAMSGMAWLTGHPDGPMLLPRGPADPNAAAHAAFALLAALSSLEPGEPGRLVEVPLLECALNVAAVGVVEHSAYGSLPCRTGNRSPLAAPQGVYACAGDEQWLALSVPDDAAFRALAELLGEPALAEEDELCTRAGRWRAHDRLDELIGAWAARLGLEEAVEALLAAGIPAGRVVDHREVSSHPHLRGRGFIEEVDHPVVGRHPVFSLPVRYGGVDRFIRSPAPTLGQHNREVLAGILGLDEATLAALAEEGVIGEEPA